MTKRTTWAVGMVAFLLGGLAVQTMPPVFGQVAQQPKGPKWQYGLGLQVRKGDEANFGKDTKKFGVEIFRDDNNGNLIYMSETGSIAVVPGK